MGRYKKWKLEDLKKGFDRFYLENGRMPTVNEVDKIGYLPSSRWIQLKFGGLIRVRKILGYKDYHLGAGNFRSRIARRADKFGIKFEHKVEHLLVKKFGEPFVHLQRRVGHRRNRLDFFIYCVSRKFGVDVVSTNGLFRDLQTNINVKISKYKDLPFEIIVVVESSFSQEAIDKWIKSKINPLPSLWRVLTYKNFIEYIRNFKPYLISLNASDRFAKETHRKFHPLADAADER